MFQEIFQVIRQGSVKSAWNKWWQSKTGKVSAPKSFHPALAAHMDDLIEKNKECSVGVQKGTEA